LSGKNTIRLSHSSYVFPNFINDTTSVVTSKWNQISKKESMEAKDESKNIDYRNIYFCFSNSNFGLYNGSPLPPPNKKISVPDKKVTSSFEGEEITSQTNVVKGGLGYSFDLFL
jgi:hypothetical protein